MKLTDIRITEENHYLYDVDPDGLTLSKNRCYVEIMMDIEKYLCSILNLEVGDDVAGKYAYFLDRTGIDSNSAHGWWSLSAIDHDNITSFVEYSRNPFFAHRYDKASENYKRAKGKISHSFTKISEFVNHFKN